MITEKTYKALKILEPTKNYSVVISAFVFANHFYELGMAARNKAQKGE